MRLRSFLASLWELKQWYTVEWWTHSGSDRITRSVFQKQGEELECTEHQDFESWASLIEASDKKIPILLVVNTNQVVSRLTPKTASGPVPEIQHFFPDLDPDNFYYETAVLKGDHYAALVGRSAIEPILSELGNHGFYLIDMMLGLAPIAALTPLIENGTLALNRHLVDIEDHGISIQDSSSDSESEVSIEGITLSGKSVLGLGSVLTHLQGGGRTNNMGDTLHPIQSEFGYQRKFRTVGVALLAAFFVILLINFFFFNSYFSRTQDLEQWATTSTMNKEVLTTLDENVRQKESRVRAIWGQFNSRTSLKVDDLAGTIPSSVILEAIQYQPLARPLQKGDPVELREAMVIMTGTHRDPDAYSKWLADMEQLDWVETVRTLQYQQEGTTRYSFEIEIREHVE